MAMAADPDPLTVIGGDDHRRAVEVAACLAPREERLDGAVGLLDLREVLGVVAAARVAGLVHAA